MSDAFDHEMQAKGGVLRIGIDRYRMSHGLFELEDLLIKENDK